MSAASVTPAALDPSDTSTWLPLDGLAPGFDANRAPLSRALAGRTITVTDPRGTRIVHRFGADRVEWEYHPGEGDPIAATAHGDDYEAFDVDDELVYVQFHHEYLPEEAVSMVLDLRSGEVLTVISIVGPEGQVPRVQQVFVPGRIEEVAGRADVTTAGAPQVDASEADASHADASAADASASAPAPAGPATSAAPHPSTELIGRRAFWVYSPEHAYEHLYLSPEWYTWQCLAGPERGLADTDANTVWQVRPGIYVFAWREKVIPCASVTIADHRSAHALRSHGALFGLDGSGEGYVHFTFGAHGRLLSTTVHPEGFSPEDFGGAERSGGAEQSGEAEASS
ncbi:molybdenum cofactor biosynthesis F family protein [Herbiconiux sp. YIM B11900]|uniref:molybdenum cofactor biosynthesis F family protein n=1 Tax=Herbiconiux sp. YIM B11900 TaxID=3404131 RepID=UPI003F876546